MPGVRVAAWRHLFCPDARATGAAQQAFFAPDDRGRSGSCRAGRKRRQLFQHPARRGEAFQDDGRWPPADRRPAVRARFHGPPVFARERADRRSGNGNGNMRLPACRAGTDDRAVA